MIIKQHRFHFVLTIVLMLAIVASCNSGSRYEVRGGAMEPGYQGGQLVEVTKINPGGIRRGDVIMYTHDDGTWIKRVVGLPGETLEIKDGEVYINGERLDESYKAEIGLPSDDYDLITIGENEFFVMGDNRKASNDSRNYGPISGDAIIGKVLP